MTYPRIKNESLLGFSANYHFKKSCTVGLYATHMYGEVEDLTLHIDSG